MKENIACFGDSLIYRFPYDNNSSWLDVVNRNSKMVNCLNYGECGFTCDDIFERIKSVYLPDNIHHLLVLGGANDIMQERPLKNIITDLANIANWCAGKQLNLCLILPFLTAYTNYNDRLSLLRREILNHKFDKTYILDLLPAIIINSNISADAFFDDIHPTSETYSKIGCYAVTFLDKWVERSGRI